MKNQQIWSQISTDAKKFLDLFKKYDIENDLTDFNYEKEIICDFKSKDEYKNIKSNRKKLNLVILRIHQMFAFFLKCINLDNENNDIDIMKIKSFKVYGHIIPVEEFLYVLSMIKSRFAINENAFLLTRNYLHHYIYHRIYHINPLSQENMIKSNNNNMSENDENENNNDDKNKNIDVFKCLSLLNENIGDGINNFDSLIENTKNAGEEINNSFQQLSQNLEKFTKRLKENNNNN